MAEFSIGSEGFVAVQKETTPGTKPSWSPDFILFGTEDIMVDQQSETLSVAGQTRDGTYQVLEQQDSGGPLGFALFPNSGIVLLAGVLGYDVYLSAVAADAVTTNPISTTSGVSTITLAGSKSGYKRGAWVKVNTGANTEYRQIMTTTPSNGNSCTQITVGALSINAAAAVSTVVQQVAQHCFQPIMPGTTISNPTGDFSSLWSFYVEVKRGMSSNSMFFPQTYVGKADLTFDAKVAQVQYQLESSGLMVPNTPTSYAASTADLADPVGPLAGGNHQLVAYCDPGATGTGSLQLFQDFTQLKMTIDNQIKKTPYPSQRATQKKVGKRLISGTLSYDDRSGRTVELTDLLTNNALDSLQPLFIGSTVNQGSAGSAVWAGVGIYLPNVKYTKYTPKTPIDDYLSADVTWSAQPDAADDPICQIFVMNQTGTTY